MVIDWALAIAAIAVDAVDAGLVNACMDGKDNPDKLATNDCEDGALACVDTICWLGPWFAFCIPSVNGNGGKLVRANMFAFA